ncbi:MAG: DUF1599 domain-containing protein [Saprospiraceae bacterium]|nr:DUF1599 domain-containing protein [Saprospiraceae bacterium]
MSTIFDICPNIFNIPLSNTIDQYNRALESCKHTFIEKHKDYGSAWRILRLPSLTDQMYIKASRVRSIQETGINKVGESIEGEFKALVNYGIMAGIQYQLGKPGEENMPQHEVERLYDLVAEKIRSLMLKKNQDYGEAWRDMRVSSITDMIMVKLLRIKQIEDNNGETQVSEGIEANYFDIVNYALFALILLEEENPEK